MKRPQLKQIEILDDFKIKATFINDSVFTIDFNSLFKESSQLKEKLAHSDRFKQATISDSTGWFIEWQALDIQIGADTLWLNAQAQNTTDENTRVFATWRARNGLSLTQAAKALGMTARTISAYGTGQRPVPLYIALACKGWESMKQQSI
jgi:hypothetical protein